MRVWTLGLLLILAAGGCHHRRPWSEALAGGEPVLVTPGEGAGNVRLGMGRRAVRRRLGAPLDTDDFPTGEAYWNYPWLGLVVQFQRHGVDTLFCYSGIPGGYESRAWQPFPGRTAEGVGVHSGPEDVARALGPPSDREDMDHAPIPAWWMGYDAGIGFTFRQDDGRMVYFYVSGAR